MDLSSVQSTSILQKLYIYVYFFVHMFTRVKGGSSNDNHYTILLPSPSRDSAIVDIVDIVNSRYSRYSRYSGCAGVRRGCFIFTRLIVKKDDASAALPCVQPASVRCGAGLGSHGTKQISTSSYLVPKLLIYKEFCNCKIFAIENICSEIIQH